MSLMCSEAGSGRVGVVGVRGLVGRRPVIAFIMLVLVLSWPMLLIGERVPVAVVPLALLGPAGCAFVVTWLADGRAGVRELAGRLGRWQVPGRWYLFALFGMAACYWATAYLVTAVFFPAALAPPPLGQLLVVPLFLVLLFVLPGLVEEFGWRGFLLPRLSLRLTPLRATLVVGFVWWAWHLPVRVRLDLPDGAAFAALFLVGILADSVIYTWVFHRTGESVLLVALMHAAGNTWGGLVYVRTFSVDPPGYVLFEVVRMGMYVMVAAIVIVLTRGRLGAPPPLVTGRRMSHDEDPPAGI